MVVNDAAWLLTKRSALEFIVGSPPGASSLLQRIITAIAGSDLSSKVSEQRRNSGSQELSINPQLACSVSASRAFCMIPKIGFLYKLLIYKGLLSL
ncbi:hypothetical protein [Pseudomonas sp. GM55]|uniref:hypothetical protein n=1 Tax=Pseudomonas sp. GM55 TaxID=1144333 RepID=UPI001EE63889|nr:hypothetical protein [Pseudomonas sp. GM55]